MDPVTSIPEDALLAIAEVAVAVLGFAAIVIALRRDSRDSGIDVLTAMRVRILAQTASTALLFSFLPIVLRSSSLSDEIAVSVSSGLLSATALASIIVGLTRQKITTGEQFLPESRTTDLIGAVIALLICLSLGARSVGYFPALGFGPYLGALVYLLLAAIAVFVRTVFFVAEIDQADLWEEAPEGEEEEEFAKERV